MAYLLTIKSLEETSSVLRISGSDAYTYLQGQFTQDLNRPAPSASYGLWLTAKGRIAADGWVLRLDDNAFIAFSSGTNSVNLRARLESNLVADEVDLTDETAQWSMIEVWGQDALVVAGAVSVGISAGAELTIANGRLCFRGRRNSGESVVILLPRAEVDALERELSARGAVVLDKNAAEAERIASGVPAVPADLGVKDLPNEGGLDESAISYTKGCYAGQEVMARLKNLGQVRRRLHVVQGRGPAPAAGAAVFQKGKNVGEFRSSAPTAEGFVAMAMLTLMHLDANAPVGANQAGPDSYAVVRRV